MCKLEAPLHKQCGWAADGPEVGDIFSPAVQHVNRKILPDVLMREKEEMSQYQEGNLVAISPFRQSKWCPDDELNMGKNSNIYCCAHAFKEK